MRKLVWIGFILALSALAQGRAFLEASAANITLTLTNPAQFNMTIFALGGVRELAGPFGLQGGLGLGVQQGTAQFAIEVGALFSFGRSGLTPEAGLGFGASFGGQNTLFQIYALGGFEWAVNRNVSLIVNTRPTVEFGSGTTTFGIRLGTGLRVYP